MLGQVAINSVSWSINRGMRTARARAMPPSRRSRATRMASPRGITRHNHPTGCERISASPTPPSTIVLGGVGLALILSHPVGWLCRVMPRGLAILVALLLLLGGIALALAVLIPLLIDQLTELIATWPSIQDTLVQLLDDATQGLRTRGLLPEEGASLTDRIRTDLSVQAQTIATGLLVGLLDVASGAAGFAVQVFAILFI